MRFDNLLLGGMAFKALLKYKGGDVLPYLVDALPHVHIMTQAIPAIRTYAHDANHHVREWAAITLKTLGAL